MPCDAPLGATQLVLTVGGVSVSKPITVAADGCWCAGFSCDDGDACTHNDVCHAGAVCSGTSYACAASECQASSSCDGLGGCTIVNKADATECSSDNNACTTDGCQAGACVHQSVNDATTCDDGDPCTQQDICNGAGVCSGSAYTCPGGTQCAASSICDGQGGCSEISQSPAGTPCDDGSACTHNDVCDGAGSCGGTGFSCIASQCDVSASCNGDDCTYVHKPSGTACNDLDPCTLDDTCSDGICSGSTKACDTPPAPSCETTNVSRVYAAVGTCDPADGECAYTASQIDCAACGDSCNPATGLCTTEACCGVTCNSPPAGGCYDASGTCTDGRCDYPKLAEGVSCADDDLCNGSELCQSGQCRQGTRLACDDGNACTIDTCDPSRGCVREPLPQRYTCDDGDPCTVGDACDGRGTCKAGDRSDDCAPDAGSTPDAGPREIPAPDAGVGMKDADAGLNPPNAGSTDGSPEPGATATHTSGCSCNGVGARSHRSNDWKAGWIVSGLSLLKRLRRKRKRAR